MSVPVEGKELKSLIRSALDEVRYKPQDKAVVREDVADPMAHVKKVKEAARVHIPPSLFETVLTAEGPGPHGAPRPVSPLDDPVLPQSGMYQQGHQYAMGQGNDCQGIDSCPLVFGVQIWEGNMIKQPEQVTYGKVSSWWANYPKVTAAGEPVEAHCTKRETAAERISRATFIRALFETPEICALTDLITQAQLPGKHQRAMADFRAIEELDGDAIRLPFVPVRSTIMPLDYHDYGQLVSQKNADGNRTMSVDMGWRPSVDQEKQSIGEMLATSEKKLKGGSAALQAAIKRGSTMAGRGDMRRPSQIKVQHDAALAKRNSRSGPSSPTSPGSWAGLNDTETKAKKRAQRLQRLREEDAIIHTIIKCLQTAGGDAYVAKKAPAEIKNFITSLQGLSTILHEDTIGWGDYVRFFHQNGMLATNETRRGQLLQALPELSVSLQTRERTAEIKTFEKQVVRMPKSKWFDGTELVSITPEDDGETWMPAKPKTNRWEGGAFSSRAPNLRKTLAFVPKQIELDVTAQRRSTWWRQAGLLRHDDRWKPKSQREK